MIFFSIREPPGCPPGLPPDINDDGEIEEFSFKHATVEEERLVEDTSQEDSESSGPPTLLATVNKPTSLQQKMVS